LRALDRLPLPQDNQFRNLQMALVGMHPGAGKNPLIHFETRASKPRVFRITSKLIADAMARWGVPVTTSLGEDLQDTSWLSGAVGLVTSNDILCDPLFPLQCLASAAPQLRWIHITGAGIEPLLPLRWLPKGVTLTNNSGVHVEKIRESAAMLLLMLNARLPAIVTNQRHARWQQIFSSTIRGQVALVVGVGDMGGAISEAARMLGLRVLGVRRSGVPHDAVDRMYRPDELDAALPLADFLVLAAPLTTATTALMDRRRFRLLKWGVGLINVGRAGLIDHPALADALANGMLSGAILDVYDPEPLPPESALWHLPNVILMPHVTSDDEEQYLPKTLDLVFDNAARLLAGQPLVNVVDPAREY
jgi:phosphoglycerate dehydrogenase-like enzyme